MLDVLAGATQRDHAPPPLLWIVTALIPAAHDVIDVLICTRLPKRGIVYDASKIALNVGFPAHGTVQKTRGGPKGDIVVCRHKDLLDSRAHGSDSFCFAWPRIPAELDAKRTEKINRERPKNRDSILVGGVELEQFLEFDAYPFDNDR